jgi:hypothetical protein
VTEQVIAEPHRSFFIVWTFRDNRPDAIEYEFTPLGGGPPVTVEAAVDEAVSVEALSTVRHRARWGITFGGWSDDPWGLWWKKPQA